MKKPCWCPICGMNTTSGKVRWLWFFVFLLFLRGAFLIYLIYCLLTPNRICERCHKRIPYIPPKHDKFGEDQDVWRDSDTDGNRR